MKERLVFMTQNPANRQRQVKEKGIAKRFGDAAPMTAVRFCR